MLFVCGKKTINEINPKEQLSIVKATTVFATYNNFNPNLIFEGNIKSCSGLQQYGINYGRKSFMLQTLKQILLKRFEVHSLPFFKLECFSTRRKKV